MKTPKALPLLRRATYGEEANRAINQTVMRSISTFVISALPIIALFAVAVRLMGIGTLARSGARPLIASSKVFSPQFSWRRAVVSIVNRSKKIKKHNQEVAEYRARGDLDGESAEIDNDIEHRTIASPENDCRRGTSTQKPFKPRTARAEAPGAPE